MGFGLLLLRHIVAARFFKIGIPMLGTSPVALLFALVWISTALFLNAGVGTSASACVGAVCSILLILGNEPEHWFPVLSLAALSSSLALLGPGGYSLEARLSGWRTIHLSSRPTSDRIGN